MVMEKKFHKAQIHPRRSKKAVVGPYRVKALKIGRFSTVLQVILGLEEGQHRVLSNLTEISIAHLDRRPPKSRNISHLDGPPKYCNNMFDFCIKP